jgi:hypothetical protein
MISPPTADGATSSQSWAACRSFSKLVLFAILHIMVVLSCLALAFIGNAPLLAIILGVGGTVALLAALTIIS